MFGDITGQTIGPYELREELGRGGMAVVYRAWQATMEREVAIKILPTVQDSSQESNIRFESEAKISSKLEHPFIVPVYDYSYGPPTYFVMRLLLGGTLDERRKKNRVPSLHEASLILNQVSSALDYAHSKSIVHRDIKTSNVIFDLEGNAYLTDFGIAKIQSQAGFTATGMNLGTPSYMAPEIWKGQEATPQSDLYALGIVLYAMLSTKLPFEATNTFALMTKHMNEVPIPLTQIRAEISPTVQRIIEKAIAKDPRDRYQSAGDMARDFSQAIGGQPEAYTGFLDPSSTRPVPTAAAASASAASSTPPSRPVPVQGSAARRQEPPPPYVPPVRPANQQRKRQYALVAAALVVVLFIVGGIGAVLILGDDDSDNGDNGERNTTDVAGERTITEPPTISPMPTQENADTSPAPGGNEIETTETDNANNPDTDALTQTVTALAAANSSATNPEITLSPTFTTEPVIETLPSYTATATNTPTVDVITAAAQTRSAIQSETAQQVQTETIQTQQYYDGLTATAALATSTSTPSQTPTPSLTSTPTLTPTSTLSPTNTPSPTPSPTEQGGGGQKVAFSSFDGDFFQLQLMNRDGSELVTLSSPGADYLNPAWSPDGTRLLFESNIDGDYDIYVIRPIEGAIPSNLTNDEFTNSYARWSPDGEQIAFWSDRDGKRQIYVMNADGSNPQNISNSPGDDVSPAWSPNGEQIAFRSTRDGNWEIYVMNADGSDQQRLTENNAFDDRPIWSPDGSQILFHGTQRAADPSAGSDWQIFTMNRDGTNTVVLIDLPRSTVNVDGNWSPDGEWVVFSSDADGDTEIYILDLLTRTIDQLTRNDNLSDRFPTWQTAPTTSN
jgi:serine/threonine-protein kinase